MSQLPNIGLFAKMRSGKDEVYKIIRELGYDVERVAFGDVMKEYFFDTFPNIPKEPKPTKLLQLYGEAMREIDPYVWVDKTMNRVRVKMDIYKNFGVEPRALVFTDIRNSYEYDAVKQLGAVMVKIEAPEELRIQRMLALGEEVSLEVLNAPTELVIDSFHADYVLYNNGTRDDLKRQVIELIQTIQQEKGLDS